MPRASRLHRLQPCGAGRGGCGVVRSLRVGFLLLIAITALLNVAWTTRVLDSAVKISDPKAAVFAGAIVGGHHVREGELADPDAMNSAGSLAPTTADEGERTLSHFQREPQTLKNLKLAERAETKNPEPQKTENLKPTETETPETDETRSAKQQKTPVTNPGPQETSYPEPPSITTSEPSNIKSNATNPGLAETANPLTSATQHEGINKTALGSTPTNSSALPVHYTAKLPSPSMEIAWTAVNGPHIDIRYYSDDDARVLVAQHRPHFLEIYTTQLSPVERADYFRYLVLWIYGGLYIDSDIQFVRPVDQWLGKFGWDPIATGWRQLQTMALVVGVEFPEPQRNYFETGWLPLQFTQFVIAGSRGSTVLARILDHVETCVRTVDRRGDVERTLQRTGPAAFTRAILNVITARGVVNEALDAIHKTASDPRYPRALLPCVELEKNGQLIPLRGDSDNESDRVETLLVLPYRAFAFHPAHGLAKEAVLTRHLFHNSWRKKHGTP